MGAGFRRLTLADRSNLAIETREAPMHVGALAVIEATAPLELAELRRRMSLRLSRAPELRQRVHSPGPPRGGPVWVDDEDFAIERHVRASAVPAPGGEAEVLTTAAALLHDPLDRSRPLWELWLLTGLTGGRMGLLLKLHHAVADGLAVVALLSALFDFEPDAPDPPAVAWAPAPRPSGPQLLVDAWSERLAALAAGLRHPLRALRGIGSVLAEAIATARGPAAPRTSLNGPLHAERGYRVLRLDLEAVRAASHAHGGKANDALLAVVAGGLRELLQARGERVGGVELQVTVPVALRSRAAARELGNVAGVMRVPLPVGEADAGRRLDLIAAATRSARARQHPTYGTGLIAWLAASGLARPLIARQRLVNVFVTNVPGPPVPLYVFGARIVDTIPITILSGNVGISFAAFSYCGRLSLVTIVDAAACPDVDVIVAGQARAWAELAKAP